MATHELDCKGLKCPMPIVRLSQRIRQIPSGDAIEIEADDPAFPADLAAWIRRFDHTLASAEAGPIHRATIVKK